jgi:hypothetical protein
MGLQLWVPLAVVAVVLVIVVVVKFRRASQVFNRIIAQVDEFRADELGRHRSVRGRRTAKPGQRGFIGYQTHGQHRSRSRH